MHNASMGRSPVLVFAGLCPSTEDGAHMGSRTEYMHWIQDVKDQKGIVEQYCRYAQEVKMGHTMKEMVARALQFSESEPKGPTYLCATREVMEQEIQPHAIPAGLRSSVSPMALPEDAVERIVEALVRAKSPLIITGYSGRNRECPSELVQLANTIPGLRFLDTAGSDMCFPSHPAFLGMTYGVHPAIQEADVILTLECPVPWVPVRNRPGKEALIYQIDTDPLSNMMPVSFFPANERWRATSLTALRQMNNHIQANSLLVRELRSPSFVSRKEQLISQHTSRLKSISTRAGHGPNGNLTADNTTAAVKRALPADTTFVIEAVTNAVAVSDQLQPSEPGSWLNCGGTGIGWSTGAALGIRLALDSEGQPDRFVCQIVGDGTFLSSVPSSAYWIAARYQIPTLCIVLVNRGWNAPRKSLNLVHPEGLASERSNREIHLAIDCPLPAYADMARAAAGNERSFGGKGVYAARASTMEQFEMVLAAAVEAVKAKRSAVIEAILGDS